MISLCALSDTQDNSRFNEKIFITATDTLFSQTYHSGDLAFVKHLLHSQNIDDQTDGVVWLFRPIDYVYAENWVMKSSHVPDGCKSRLQHAIRRMSKAPELWFSIMVSERQRL